MVAGTTYTPYLGSVPESGSAFFSVRADEDCSPLCDNSTRRSIENRLLVSDISGAVGLGLLGLAAYTFVNRPVVHDSGVSASTNPTPRGVTLTVRGRF